MKIFKFFLVFLLNFSLLSTVFAASVDVNTVAVFKNGLNIKNLKSCQQKLNNTCDESKYLSIPDLMACQKKVFKNNQCPQNLALLNNERALFNSAKKYQNVVVINATVYAADYSEAYLMVDSQGEVVHLTGDIPLTNNEDLENILKKYPNTVLWPIANDFPKGREAYQKGVMLVFSQLMTDGCKACAHLGYADIGYYFDAQGKFIAVKLLGLST